MARQGISTGSVPNDGTGDTLLDGAVKINDNFVEVYDIIGDGTNTYVGIVTQITAGTNVSISTAYGSVEIGVTGISTGNIKSDTITAGVATITTLEATTFKGSGNAAGGTDNTFLDYTGTTKTDGSLYGGTDAPTNTTRLNYDGAFHATNVHGSHYGDGSNLNNLDAADLASGTVPDARFPSELPAVSGTELTGIVTSITAGSNITISGSTGNVTINATGGGGGSGSGIDVGYASTDGGTPVVVGTAITQVNFVGSGYTVTVSGSTATVRNLKMDLKKINFTSPGYATTSNEGTQITYAATVNDANAVFAIEDTGGLNSIGINYSSGVMGGGQLDDPGTYTVKLRASTPFGMSDSFPVTFTIDPFTLSMDTIFGDAESLLAFDDDISGATYVSLATGGVVVNDGANYVIDRDDSILSDATNHALYYDNNNNALIGFRYSSGGVLNGIGRWTSVASASDGTDVGSGSMWTTTSSVLASIGSTYNSLRGPNLGIGTAAGIGSTTSGYQPVGQYNGGFVSPAFYMRIQPNDSTLDNFGTRIDNADWSYGFTLEDPWLMGSPSQLLCPESNADGWYTNAYRRYRIGDSYFNSYNYGEDTFQGNSSSGFKDAWDQQTSDENNIIAYPGSTVAVYFDDSANQVLLFINGENVHTGTSQYLYMKSSGSTSQPALSFGDTSPQLFSNIPNDDDEITGWPFRIRDLWIANNAGISTSDIVSISTFRNRNLDDYSGYSNIDTYITLTSSDITAVKGNVSIARSAISFT